jgi:hypothetical protein
MEVGHWEGKQMGEEEVGAALGFTVHRRERGWRTMAAADQKRATAMAASLGGRIRHRETGSLMG